MNKKPSSINLTFNLTIDFESLAQLPAHVFLKDGEGRYLAYNDFGAKTLGFKSGLEIIGKTDYEIFPSEIAGEFRKNDIMVISAQSRIFVPEKGVLKDNLSVTFLSYKTPLFNQGNIQTGVLGIAFTRPSEDMLFLPSTFAHKINYHHFSTNSVFSNLSKQEKLCVNYFLKGLTYKQISRELNVSPRTVETYIKRIKQKLNCSTKTELITIYQQNFVQL